VVYPWWPNIGIEDAPHETIRWKVVRVVPGCRTREQFWVGIKHVDLVSPSLQMLLRSVLLTIFALPTLINGGQFPILNGVIGGVPSPGVHDSKTRRETFSTTGLTPTPGKLRVVENSGICG
jgi:hypothetical protein